MEDSFASQERLLSGSRENLLSGELFDAYHETIDGFLVEFAKRMYAIAPLLIMAYSTINQVFVIAKSVASQSSVETYYDSEVRVESNGQQTYYTCEHGDAEAVVVYCPYYTIDAFIGILSVWVIYFALFISIRFIATFQYATDDLRFYLAVDLYNSHWLNRTFVYIGGVLTLVSMSVGLYYMSPSTQWNPTVDNTSLLSIILFVGINTLALSGFRKQFIEADHSVHISDFEDYVPLYNVKFYHGVERVMTPIVASYVRFLTSQNDADLQLRGDGKLLRRALAQLYR